jgi:hypothetical protein
VFNPIDCLLLGDVYMDGWIDAVTILYVWVNNGKLSTSSYERMSSTLIGMKGVRKIIIFS